MFNEKQTEFIVKAINNPREFNQDVKDRVQKYSKQKTIPVYEPTYKKAGFDHKGNPQFEVQMKVVGQATSYADAKAKFGVLAIVDGYAREVEEE